MVLSNRLTFALHNPIFGIRQRLVVSIKEFGVMNIENNIPQFTLNAFNFFPNPEISCTFISFSILYFFYGLNFGLTFYIS